MFTASVAGTGIDATNRNAIWSNAGGSVHPVVQLGSAAPGTSAGTTFALLYDRAKVVDSAGQVGFVAQVTGPDVNSSNDHGVWQEQGGSLTLLVRTGAPAPGTEDGTVFSGIRLPQYYGRGRLPFRASLSGPNVTSSNDEGIWSQAGGNLELVWREGSPVPGVDAGVSFLTSAIFPLEFNDPSELTFMAALTGPGVTTSNDLGIWSSGEGTFHLVAREGMEAPGMQSGFTFARFGEYGDPVINDTGQVAFWAQTRYLSSTFSSGEGIWAEGPNGLQLVARSGQAIKLANGTTANIGHFDLFRGSSPQQGRGMIFNSNNQIAFWVILSNGTSAVVMTDLNPFQPGDYTGDGVVDAADYIVWRNTLGSNTDLAADGTGNGIIDEGDLVIWRQNFDETITDGIPAAASAAEVAVPEPNACVLLVLSGASLSALLRSRRRRRVGTAHQLISALFESADGADVRGL